MSRMIFGAVLASTLAACGSETTILRQTQVDTFEQVPNDEVDILFVVDDSNSMAEEQAALAQGFIGFMAQLESVNSKFHLGMVTTSTDGPDAGHLLGSPPVLDVNDDYLARFRSRVQVGTDGSDYERGLWSAELALSPALLDGPNRGFLRPEATLLVAFVTDEEDCSDDGALAGQESVACYQHPERLTPVDQTYDALLAAKGGDAGLVRVGAIIGGRGDSACDTAWPGARYAELAVKAGGMIGDICSADWSDMLARMGLQAIGLRDSFPLSYDAIPETIVVHVDDVEVASGPTDGWTYDGVNDEIRFHGRAVPGRGAVVVAEYEILTGI